MSRLRVGIDVGGTFTDLVLVAPTGEALTRKVLSATDDYATAIVAGTLGGWLKTNRHYLRMQRYVSGTVFVALGALAALSAPVKQK